MNLLFKLFYAFFIFNTSTAFIPPIHVPHLADINIQLAESVVKTSTAILPQFDSIGHIVLSTNELLINKVLETKYDPVIKKKIILYIINLSKQGDEMGGKILQNYYNLIDHIL